jgi:hypothetical protein
MRGSGHDKSIAPTLHDQLKVTPTALLGFRSAPLRVCTAQIPAALPSLLALPAVVSIRSKADARMGVVSDNQLPVPPSLGR